jgi:DNA-binding NtrC family response regulator
MGHLKIFIAEDDAIFAKTLQYHLSLNPDNEVEIFKNAKELLKNLHKKPDVITLDYYLDGSTGDEVLKSIQSQYPKLPVIIVSSQQEIKKAVDLLHNGAYDYVVKDQDTKDRIWNIVNRISEHNELVDKVENLQEIVEDKFEFSNLILGESEAMKKVFKTLHKAANSNIVVSITGETGTGKELAAKSIHFNSDRKDKPFVAVNVAAIPENLIESELFGNEKGAFTGADGRRIGKFEEAKSGTIFLDEIGDMDLQMQSKLLRVLQENEVTRIGGNETVKLDVRVIVATHKNLADEVSKGNFREDLYYRLFGLYVELPALRDRGNDVLLLANNFLAAYCKKNKEKKKKFTPEAAHKLKTYKYPGNVRELKAICDLAVVMADGDEIHEDDIQIMYKNKLDELVQKEMTLEEYDKAIMWHFLKKYNYKVRLVANKLGIGKSTIYRVFQNELVEMKDQIA